MKKLEDIIGSIGGWVIIIGIIYYFFFSDTAKIKDYLECSIAANQLSQYKAMGEMDRNIARTMVKSELSSREISQIAQEVRDDMGLYKLNSRGKYNKLVDIYNSRTCQKMHTQGEIND